MFVTGTLTEIYMVRPKRRDVSCQTENVDNAPVDLDEHWQDEEIVNLPSDSVKV